MTETQRYRVEHIRAEVARARKLEAMAAYLEAQKTLERRAKRLRESGELEKVDATGKGASE